MNSVARNRMKANLGNIPGKIKQDLQSYEKSHDLPMLIEVGRQLIEARKLLQGKNAEWSELLDEIGVPEDTIETFEKLLSERTNHQEACLKVREILLKMLAVNTSRIQRVASCDDGEVFEKTLPAWIEYQEACLKERKILLETLTASTSEIRCTSPDEEGDGGINAEPDGGEKVELRVVSA